MAEGELDAGRGRAALCTARREPRGELRGTGLSEGETEDVWEGGLVEGSLGAGARDGRWAVGGLKGCCIL